MSQENETWKTAMISFPGVRVDPNIARGLQSAAEKTDYVNNARSCHTATRTNGATLSRR